MTDLQATRLSLTPFCHIAPPTSLGDIIRVTDGTTTVYLDPTDYDAADETQLRALLAGRLRNDSGTLAAPGDASCS